MAFNIPVQTTLANIRPSSPPTPWTRQPDWVNITSVNDTEILFLVSDATETSYKLQVNATGTGNLYIDWGDGSPLDTVSSFPGTASHTYVEGTGTPCSLGYTTWKVTITTDLTLSPTQVVFINPNVGNTGNHTIGLLEAWFGSGLQNLDMSDQFNPNAWAVNFLYLQYVKCPTYTAKAGLPALFYQCYSLAKVDYYTSLPNATSQVNAFYQCTNLQELTFPSDMVNIANWGNTFNFCSSLYSVTLPPTLNSTSDISYMFFNCTSLSAVEFPALPALTTTQFTFSGCWSIINFNFKGLKNSSGTIAMDSMFRDCKSLQNVTFPTTVASGVVLSLANTFENCNGLINVTFPSNCDISTLANTFLECTSIQEIIFPTSTPSLANLSTTFQSCRNLQSITLPTTVSGSSIDMSNAFRNCNALTEVTVPSGWILGSLSSTFRDSGVRSVNLPNNPQNSCTTMANAFQSCFNLETVVLPTETAAVTSIISAFNGCYKLQTVTLPAVMTLCNNASSAFTTSRSLTTVIWPTSMPACTTFLGVFQSCPVLQEVTLPATVGAVTTFSGAFNGCLSLREVTLPTTQTTSLTATSAFTNMFSGCVSLKTINNLDKLGNNAVGSTSYMAAVSMFPGSPQGSLLLTSADFTCKFASLKIAGTVGEPNSFFTSLRLRNSGTGQYAGTAPQIDIKYSALGQAALVQVFNDLPTVTGKQIDITGCSGAAALTAGERAIATGKGWTIIG